MTTPDLTPDRLAELRRLVEKVERFHQEGDRATLEELMADHADALLSAAEERDQMGWRLARLVDRCRVLGEVYGQTGAPLAEAIEGVLNALQCAETGCHPPGETEEQRIAWCSEVERLADEIARLTSTLAARDKTLAELREALEDIVNPLPKIEREAKAQDRVLNGGMMARLLDDANWYRGKARAALASSATEEPTCKQCDGPGWQSASGMRCNCEGACDKPECHGFHAGECGQEERG